MDEILVLDAMGQAEAVRGGEVSPRELIEATIARIERVNPKVNAVVTPLFDEARREIAQGIPAGPFAGVPFLLKDLLAEYAGSPLTGGSAFVAGCYRSITDSELVTRYRRAGLVPPERGPWSRCLVLWKFGRSMRPDMAFRTATGIEGLDK